MTLPTNPDEVAPITLTLKRTCEVSSLGMTTVRELIGRGKLKSIVIGKRRLVDYASLKALLSPGARLRRKPGPKPGPRKVTPDRDEP